MPADTTSTDLAPAEVKKPTTLPQAIQAGDRVPMLSFGGTFMIQPQSVGELVEVAKLMAGAGPLVGKAVRGNVGACLGIILQAGRCNMDPFALSLKTYMVNDQIAYEAQAVAAMIYASPVLDGRLDYEFEGAGDTLVCTVRGRIKGESKERVYTSPPKGSIKTQNSPLWKADPEQQLGYYSARAWARRHVPDVIMGVYTREEVEAIPGGFVNVTPEKADPSQRLIQNLAEGRRSSELDKPEPDPPATAQPVPAADPDTDEDETLPIAAETEGEAGDQPAAEAEPSVRELPPKPGALIRTKKGVTEWARAWAAYWLAIPKEDEDDFWDETEADQRVCIGIDPNTEDVFNGAINSKGAPA